MSNSSKIKVFFSDVGGVLLTNGWDHKSRAKAVEKFNLNAEEFESRHQLIFGDFEVGKISLSTYLRYTVFYQPREFSPEDFTEFMHQQSQAFPEMIQLMKKVKKDHHLKIVLISNEGRELTDYRIKKFHLDEFADFFIVSCFLGIRKPDQQVWKMALDFVQVPPKETLYMDDRQLFVEIAQNLGIQSFCHKTYAETKAALEKLFQEN